MLSNSERDMLAMMSGERARNNVAELVFPMDRNAGSQAELDGANKVKDMLAPLVDKCELEGAPVVSYLKRMGLLEVVSPVSLSIPCQAAPLSGSGSGEAILVDVGAGTITDYEKLGATIDGAAVIGSLPPGATLFEVRIGIALEAKRRKAKCLIFHLPEKSDELVPLHALNVDFPGLLISNRHAVELRSLLSQHKEVRVRFETQLENADGTTYNVVGTITGHQYPQEVIYLTSHHDTWYYGASDNNASTACLLEVATVLKQHRPKRTVKFVIVGSEESGIKAGVDMVVGLRGSYGYTEIHRAELENRTPGKYTLCNINGEILGFTPRSVAMCSPELLPLARDVAADLGHYSRATEITGHWVFSDNLCFHTLGVPTISYWPAEDLGTNQRAPFFRLYHTIQDDINAISPIALVKNSSFLTLLTNRIDSADLPPYSLETLVSVGKRGTDYLSNRDSISTLLTEKTADCYRAEGREEILKRILKLVATVNQNTYAFIGWSCAHKFEFLSDAFAKLRDACNIVEMEGDFGRARAVLRTIKGASLYDDFTKEVMAEIDKMENASAIISRLPRCSIDLHDIFWALRKKGKAQSVLSHIKAKIGETEHMRNAWGTEYEQALKNL